MGNIVDVLKSDILKYFDGEPRTQSDKDMLIFNDNQKHHRLFIHKNHVIPVQVTTKIGTIKYGFSVSTADNRILIRYVDKKQWDAFCRTSRHPVQIIKPSKGKYK